MDCDICPLAIQYIFTISEARGLRGIGYFNYVRPYFDYNKIDVYYLESKRSKGYWLF